MYLYMNNNVVYINSTFRLQSLHFPVQMDSKNLIMRAAQWIASRGVKVGTLNDLGPPLPTPQQGQVRSGRNHWTASASAAMPGGDAKSS